MPEVQEETGLRVEPPALTGVNTNMRRGIHALAFRAASCGWRAQPSDEVNTVEWIPRERLSDVMDGA